MAENSVSGPAFDGVFFPCKQAASFALKSKPNFTMWTNGGVDDGGGGGWKGGWAGRRMDG